MRDLLHNPTYRISFYIVSNARMPCINTLRKVMIQHFCVQFLLNMSGAHKEKVLMIKNRVDDAWFA